MDKDLALGDEVNTMGLTMGDFEIIREIPACNLEKALSLVAEYNRLFPSGMGFALLSCDWISLPGEKAPFANALDLKIKEARNLLGISRDAVIAELSEDLRAKYFELLYSALTPRIISLFAERKVKTISDIRALIDDEKRPLDSLYVEACIRDARINVPVLLQRMSQRMDMRDLSPDFYHETEEMRDGFRRLVDNVLGRLGFEKVKPFIAVIKKQ